MGAVKVTKDWFREDAPGVMEPTDEALAAFRQAEALGLRGYKGTYAAAYASRRDYNNALRVIGEQQLSGVVSKDLEHQLTLAAFEADQGHIVDAVRRIGLARRETEMPVEADLRFRPVRHQQNAVGEI